MNLGELAQEYIEIYQKTLKTSIPITRPSIPILCAREILDPY